jgi:hypothetical protein
MRKALPDLTGKRAGLALAITLAALFAAGAAHLYFQDDIVSTPEAASEAMAELTKELFGGPLPGATGTLEPVASPIPLTGLSDTKRIVFANWASRPRVWTPAKAGRDVVIFHQGHDWDYAGANAQAAIQKFLDAGYVVVGMVMPGGTETKSGSPEAHNTAKPPLADFIGPVIGVINTLSPDHDRFFMTGLSGGGWTTTLAAAVDTRIAKSYPIAGSLPLEAPGNRDYEQFLPGLSTGYPDLYVLGTTPGRRQKQILYRGDKCCFNYGQYRKAPYAERVSEAARSAGGDFDLVWIDRNVHAWDAKIIEDEILPEIKAAPPP